MQAESASGADETGAGRGGADHNRFSTRRVALTDGPPAPPGPVRRSRLAWGPLSPGSGAALPGSGPPSCGQTDCERAPRTRYELWRDTYPTTRRGLCSRRSRVDVGEQLGAREVVVVAVPQQRGRLGVERGLGVGSDEQALDGQQRVLETQLGSPVALQCIDAYFTRVHGHIGVEELGEKEGTRRSSWELAAQHQPNAERATEVWRARCGRHTSLLLSSVPSFIFK